MISDKELTRISKFLSFVLRHQPAAIGIQLDQNGWADVNDLIQKANAHGIRFDRETLNHLVATNSKKRFAFNDTYERIRASQGHSFDIELGNNSQKPPQILFHGTSENSVQSILDSGLKKQSRQYVHLSRDSETAIKVGQRHGKPVVLRVFAEEMYNENFQFFLSDNGVWLTDNVPAKYLNRYNERD
ncbi:RNA 2'-phosphotransferase [Tellurirhabdus rosea]|uniref:RNA 2'-phosphotransferase n=1 Tax=Tellurirhabdus rosea TaxID=2674997 RepID=UPI0022560705|nr:RNA 2'-phosphotransferase [Tellurirhabdus rosea]